VSNLKPGDLVAGKLRVLELLGGGAMGAVYAVEHLTLRTRQALKVLNSDLARSPEQVERFLREGVAISRVKHRAVVQVFDAGVDHDMPWIAMELLEGETLGERISRGGMSTAEVVHIAIEVLGGLAASHAQGIVHRDLKPSNIFLARQPGGPQQGGPQPKILDFGIALVLDLNERITAVGMTMGSIQYMAPEQIHGARDADPRADVYAMGAILYEALSGRTPYRATTIPALLQELAYSPPPDLRMAAPHHPAWLAELVNRCLSRERERRPADAQVVLSALVAQQGTVMASSSPGVGGTLRMGPGSVPGSQPGAGSYPGAYAPTAPYPGSAPGSYPGSQPGHTPAPGGGYSPAPGAWGVSNAGQPSWPVSPQPGSQPGGWQQGSQPWQGSDPAVLFAQPQPSPLRHLLWIAPLAILLALGGGLGVWAAFGQDEAGDGGGGGSSQTAQVVTPIAPPQPPPPAQDLGPAMVPIQPGMPPAVAPVAPVESFPAVAPTPVSLASHPCIGRWAGRLRQSDGQRAGGTVNISGTSGQCGSFVERWDSGSVCHYRLHGCSATDREVTSNASTPAHESCSPVRMRFTCEDGQLRFHESAPDVTVTSTMSRSD
jgi:serine/threonine protein kinase